MNINTSTNTGRRTGSITATIQHAVIENNAGSKLVRQCHYDAAMKSFTSVLKILKPLATIKEHQQHDDRFEKHDNKYNSNDDDSSNDNTDNSNSSTVPFKISFMNNNNTMIMDDDTEEDTTMTGTKETINDYVAVVSPEGTASSSPEVSSSAASYTHNKLIASKQHNCSNNNNGAASAPFAARKLKYFIFHDPVIIPLENLPSRSTAATTGMTTNDDDDNFDELSLYSSEFFSKFLMIVMYNLALTLHLHALSLSSSVHSFSVSSSPGNSSSSTTLTATTIKHIKQLFLRSRKFYELAFERHLDADDVDLLFTLALINNLGLLYYTVNEKDRSTTCFKHMFSTMMYVMDSKESHSIKEWDGLLANAMDILKIGNKVAASAA